MKAAKITERDLDTLTRAHDLKRRFDAGIFPSTAGDRSHFRRLERLGLLAFDAWGHDIDREIERDVPIYELTPAGLAAIVSRSGESDDRSNEPRRE